LLLLSDHEAFFLTEVSSLFPFLVLLFLFFFFAFFVASFPCFPFFCFRLFYSGATRPPPPRGVPFLGGDNPIFSFFSIACLFFPFVLDDRGGSWLGCIYSFFFSPLELDALGLTLWFFEVNVKKRLFFRSVLLPHRFLGTGVFGFPFLM